MTTTLVQFKSGMGVPCPSPFCMKAEILLKMAGVEYDVQIIDDPRKSPKGKLPYIIDDGREIADSALIREHLEKVHGAEFDAGLSAKQKAVSHAMARMAEERLYWVIVYSRWMEDANWPVTAQFWFGGMPPLMRNLVPMLARRQTRANMQGHGIGRHNADEIYRFGIQDVTALAMQLDDQEYMFGEEPTSLDTIIYPMIANILVSAAPSPLREATQQHDNLVAYAARAQAHWFPDFTG